MSNSHNRLRFGVIGIGSIGPTHCGAIAQISDAQLVAVADLNRQQAVAEAKKYSVNKIYGDYRELIADPDIDVVCICTPSGMHADMAVDAMRAGKHVVVEKPMDVSLEACDRMIAAEKETGRKLTVISQHRFDAASVTVKQAIDSGKLGKIILATAEVKWWREQSYYDNAGWRGTWKMDGGGSLMNQGVHTVDVLQWLVGGVSVVWGKARAAGHERIETEDSAVLAMEFKCGAIGTLVTTTAAYKGLPARIEVYGTNGSAVIEGDRLTRMCLKSGEEYVNSELASHAISVAQGGTASVREETSQKTAKAVDGQTWGDAHRAQIEDLIAAIRTNTKPLIDGAAARKPVEIILATYQSQRTGQPVKLSD